LNQLWNQNAHQFDPNLSEDENNQIVSYTIKNSIFTITTLKY
ncbi:Cholesterol-capturing domain, partial [Snodgrassella alvi SCGC AB-598-J21]